MHFLIGALFGLSTWAMADGIDLGETRESAEVPDRNLPFFRIAADYGLSYHVRSNDTDMTSDGRSYMNSTMLGGAYFLEASIYPWPQGGFGVFYTAMTSDDEAHNLRMFQGYPDTYSLKTSTRFVTYGPLFSSRMRLGSGLLLGGFGFGYNTLEEVWVVNGKRDVYGAEALALLFQCGGDWPLLRAVSVGLNARLYVSSTRKYTLNGEKVHNSEDASGIYYTSLTRIECTAGLRFSL